MRLASLLAHSDGLQFVQKYVSISGGPEAGSRLRASICAAFDLTDPPALYLKYKLPTADGADNEPQHILAASSYDDAAQYILNYDSNDLLNENGDCVSVDANNQPALWVLIKQQQQLLQPAAAAAAGGAAQGHAHTHGATPAAAAAGAALQSSSASAGSSASAATAAAGGKPPGLKLQPWMEYARDTASRVLLCVAAPAGTSRRVVFAKSSTKLVLGGREAANMTPEDKAAREAQMTASKNKCFDAVVATTLHVYDKHVMPNGQVQPLTKQRVKTHINQWIHDEDTRPPKKTSEIRKAAVKAWTAVYDGTPAAVANDPRAKGLYEWFKELRQKVMYEGVVPEKLDQMLDLPEKAVNQATAVGHINGMGNMAPAPGSQLSMIMAAFKAGAGYTTGSTTVPGALAGPTGPQLQRAQMPFPVGGGGPINSGGSPPEPTEQPSLDNNGAPPSTRANEFVLAPVPSRSRNGRGRGGRGGGRGAGRSGAAEQAPADGGRGTGGTGSGSSTGAGRARQASAGNMRADAQGVAGQEELLGSEDDETSSDEGGEQAGQGGSAGLTRLANAAAAAAAAADSIAARRGRRERNRPAAAADDANPDDYVLDEDDQQRVAEMLGQSTAAAAAEAEAGAAAEEQPTGRRGSVKRRRVLVVNV